MTDKTREAWETELLAHEPTGKPQVWFTRKEVVSIISAATARAMAEAVRVCEEQFDHDEQAKADAASRTAKGVSSQLQRLRHWSTVSTYNAAVSRCITAIKEALK